VAFETPALSGERCPFCDHIAGRLTERGTPPAPVWAGEETLVFMDPRPIQPGHVLVIPRRHATSLFDLTQDEAATIARTVHACATALREALAADGLNVFQNNGGASGQTEPHFHVHLVPRHDGDGGTFPPERLRPPHAELMEVAARIAAAWPPESRP
jgi:histidine triad (HIT) family protein